MAQSKNFLDDVKRELECSVCQEQFSEINEPIILKCLHTFCKSCLEAWLRQQREGAALSCPTCRQITECPNNSINSLPSNLFYKQMVQIVEAYSGQGEEDSPHCANCDEGKSLKFYCSDCNCFLCEDCAGLHKKWKDFRGHHIKEIGNFESSDAQDYARRANVCKQHKDEVRFYCEQCLICICRDCAILEHRDHNIVSLDKGLEKKKSEIENKMRAVQTNGSSLRNQKDYLEKRRMRMNNSIEQATEEVHQAAKRNIELIRQHEASVTEQLLEQKENFQAEFSNTITSLDEKLMEIESSLDFSNHILERNNLPEILNVEEVLEKRFQELLEPSEFCMKLNHSGVKYVPNDFSLLKEPPGKLFTTNTEPPLSLAEGMGLTEGMQGEDCTFTVITMDSWSKKTYSEIDRVDVDIQSLQAGIALKANITDTRDGCYTVSYKPQAAGEFNVLITVASEDIKGSPFQLKVKGKRAESTDQHLAPEMAEENASRFGDEENEEDLEQRNPRANGMQNEVPKQHQEPNKTPPKIQYFEVEPKFIKVFFKTHEAELKEIEAEYHVEIPSLREAKRRQIGLTPQEMCSAEQYIKACDRFIDLYQKTTQSIKMERFSLKSEKDVMPSRKKIQEIGKKFPIFVEATKDRKHWELYGDARDLEAALEFLKKEKVEIKRETENAKSNEEFQESRDHEEAMDVHPPHSSRVVRNKDLLETYIAIISTTPSSRRATTNPGNGVAGHHHRTTFGSSASNNDHPLSGSSHSSSSTTSYSGAVKKTPGGSDPKTPRIQEPGGAVGGNTGFYHPPGGKQATTNRKDEDSAAGGEGSETECPICLDTVKNPRTLKCKHVFCTECVDTTLKHNNRCPVCKEVQGVIQGNQPEGEMRFRQSHLRLPGYYDCGMIIIDYFFPSGTQGPEHPNPGQRYDGTRRRAYLPDNQEGREVLQLLRRAFDARLVFTVGTSVTTGRQNQVTWNDVHHKTNISGGPQGFGYPDPDYLRRVNEDLAAKGIR